MKKYLLFILLLMAYTVKAQPGINEMQQARDDLSGTFTAARDFAWVMAGILGIAGAVRIYYNWQFGEPKFDEYVGGWFFAALFMVLAGVFVRALFGL